MNMFFNMVVSGEFTDIYLESCLEMSSLILDRWDPDGDTVKSSRSRSKKKEALEDFEPDSEECDVSDEDDSEEDSDEDYKCDLDDDDCRCTSTRSSRKCCSTASNCDRGNRKCCDRCSSKEKNGKKCKYCNEDKKKCMKLSDKDSSKRSKKKSSSLTGKHVKYYHVTRTTW